MSDHLKLIRPSNFGRSVLCPGWSRLAAVVPTPPSSDAAEEGTLLHSRLPPDQPLDDLSDEQRRQVEKARAFVAERARPGGVVYERPLRPLRGMANGGTADAVSTDCASGVDTSATVVDLKFGRLQLAETFAAWQAQVYGEMARLEFGRDCAVWFFQPRADDADSVWHATVTDKDKVTERVNAVLERAAAPDAPRIPGPEQCRYCPALAWCPEAHADADLMATVDLIASGLEDLPTPALLGALAKEARRVERMTEAVLSAVREILLAGGTVPGWQLETRKGRRVVQDPQATYEALKDTLPLEDFLALIEVPLGALEGSWVNAALAKAEDGTTKKALKEEFYRRLARVLSRRPDTRVLTQKKEDHGTGSS